MKNRYECPNPSAKERLRQEVVLAGQSADLKARDSAAGLGRGTNAGRFPPTSAKFSLQEIAQPPLSGRTIRPPAEMPPHPAPCDLK